MTLEGQPLRVYGSVISYYTGKLEAYLRYKEVPYEFGGGRVFPKRLLD
jgi:hypothetical protein